MKFPWVADGYLYTWIAMGVLADISYRDEVLRNYFKDLVPPALFFDLPYHYFALRNPYDINGTQYRFNLTRGKLRVETPAPIKFDGGACKMNAQPFRTVQCIFPISGSFANYTGELYYGRNLSQTFHVTLTAEPYTMENSGWNNPADISVHMKPGGPSGQTRLVASTSITEFIVNIIAEPEFRNFSVFKGNNTIISKVWDDFWDYAYRRCKQDMRKVAKNSFNKRIAENARSTPSIIDSLFWNKR